MSSSLALVSTLIATMPITGTILDHDQLARRAARTFRERPADDIVPAPGPNSRS